MLKDMLALPNEVVVVSAKRRGRGHGGWSKNNPYLPDVRTVYLHFAHSRGCAAMMSI